MEFFGKLLILIRRDMKTEFRFWRKSLIEVIILVVIFSIILLNPVARLYRYEFDEGDAGVTILFYGRENLDNLKIFKDELNIKTAKIKLNLAYTPIMPLTRQIAEAVVTKLGLTKAESFKNAVEMEVKFNNKTIFAAVDFGDFSEENKKTLPITIRFPSDFRTIEMGHVKDHLWLTRCNGILAKETENVGHMNTDLYLREGFLQLQHELFVSWLEATNETFDETITLSSFRLEKNPYQCDIKTTGSNLVYALFYMLFFYPFLNLIGRFGYEREHNVFVHHLKFGFKRFHHWISHFIVAFAHFMVLASIVVILGHIHWADDDFTYHFGKANFWKVILFFTLYIAALIITTMALVSFVPVVANAVLLGSLIWILTYSMFSILLYHTESINTFWAYMSFIVFFNNTFAFGMLNLRDHTTQVKEPEFWHLFYALIANILVHLILLWHITHFWPGRYVQRGRYNFLYLGSICGSSCKNEERKHSLRRMTSSFVASGLSWTHIENSPMESEMVMEIKNIDTTDEKKPEKSQIKNISMKIYSDEITIICGHNGCGKTTLLSIMAGRYEPKKGSVTIRGFDVYDEWDDARNYFDVCMPESSLFAKLDARENLLYYFQIKKKKDTDTDPELVDFEFNKYMEYLRLAIPDLNMRVDQMTHEQRRLLFLCCALCRHTAVLFLDEPTIRMRWREANLFWHILNQEKLERAIIVTTNSIDLTDRCADRILLMHEGMALAYGTKNFLKSAYGQSYKLTIVKEPAAPIDPITHHIRNIVSGIQPEGIVGEQIYYKIPKEKASLFQRLLIPLEKDADILGIKDITLYGPQLIDVYMSLGIKANKQHFVDYTPKEKIVHYLSEAELRGQHIKAMAFKKIINQAPSYIPLIMIFIVFFIILGVNQMSKVLTVPPKEEIYIELGLKRQSAPAKAFEKSLDLNDFFPPLTQCTTIVIDHIGHTADYQKLNPRVFDRASLYCVERTPYKEYITHATHSYTAGGVDVVQSNGKTVYNAYFNQKVFHSAPVLLNLVHNIILSHKNTAAGARGGEAAIDREAAGAKVGRANDGGRQSVVDKISDIYVTYLINDPMPIPLQTKVNLLEIELHHIVLPLTIGLIMPLTVSTFIIVIIEENKTQLLTLLRIAGLRLHYYWLVTYMWDIFTLMAYCIFYIIVMCFSSIDGFHVEEKLTVYLLLTIYGFPAIPLTYIISLYCRGSRLNGYLKACLVHVIGGLFLYVIYWDVADNNGILFAIAMLFPTFALIEGVSNVYTEAIQEQYCKYSCDNLTGCDEENICLRIPYCCFDTFFKWNNPGILPSIVCLGFTTLLYLFLLFWIELYRDENRFASIRNLKSLRSASYSYDDPDVTAARKRIAEADLRQLKRHSFVVDQLECEIQKSAKNLHTISFTVDKGKCFVIWGPRRCGKTHLIRQLIGQDNFCFGDIYVKGTELKYETEIAYSIMGYCPQDRGIYSNFSPRELFHIICMIRGLPENEIGRYIRDITLALDMKDFLRRKLYTLSYDMRRKVLVAVAFLVSNEILILDEPTRALSALSRRQIWNLISFACSEGKTVILTAAGSPEINYIADECIIFEDGEMLAIGGVRTVLKTHVRGFFLEVKLKLDGETLEKMHENLRKDIENLHRFVTFIHEDSELRYQRANILRYYCPVPYVVFSRLYGSLERNRKRLNVSTFMVLEGSIEDAFASIAVTRLHKEKLYPPT